MKTFTHKITRIILLISLFAFFGVSSAFASNYFWVGSTGNWSNSAQWSYSSGGAGGAGVPGAGDDVFFNGSSGTGIATLDISAGVRSLDFSGYTGTFAGTTALTIGGSLTMGTGMTRTYTGTITFTASSAQNITSNGIAFDNPITFNGTGSWALQDAFTTGTTRTVTLTQGTFNANNQNFTAGLFNSDNTNTRTLTIGSGVWSITGTGTVWTTATATNLTLNRGSAVRLTNSSATARTIISGNTGGTEANAPDISVTAGTGTLAIGLTSSTSKFRHMDYTGFAGSLVASAAPTTWYFVEIYGNLTLSTGMTIPSTMANYYFSGTSGTQVLTGNGKVWEGDMYFQGTGGSYQLADNFTFGATRTVNFTRGTLDLNGKTLSTGLFSSSNSNTRAIQFNGGTINLTATSASTVWDMTTSTNATITLTGGGTITVSGSTISTRTFAGGGKTYGTLWLSNATANGQLNITGSNTFSELKSTSAGQTILFTAGSTTTVTTWNVNGVPGSLTTIGSITSATHTLVKAGGGTVTATLLNISNSTATPGSTWSATESFDGGNNSGWFITPPTPRYWVGGTGNWSDVNHWSTGSGGAGGASLPVGDAFFDASSGGGTATIDMSAGPKSLSFAGYTGTLAGTAALTISGSLTMGATMTRTYTGTINFTASSAQTITSNGIAFDNPITFNGTGSWALQDAFVTGTTRTVTLTQGTFNANNQNFTAGIFNSDNTNTRTLTIGSGVWSITGTGTVWTTSNATNLTLNRGSAVRLTNSSATARTIISGNTGGTEANAPDISVTAGTGTLAIGLTSFTSKFRHMDYTGFAGSLVASAAPTTWYFVEIYGNFTLSTGMTIPSTMANYYFSGTSGTQVLTGNGKVWEGNAYFQGATGSYQLADNFTFGATRTVTLTSGTLNLSGNTLSSGLFSSSNSNTRAIQFNGGTIDLTATSASTVWDMTTSTNATITLTGGGTVKVSGSTTNTRTFAGGGKTYGTLWLSNATANGQMNITGSNTFAELRSTSAAQTILFTAGTTTTVTTWNVNGVAGSLTTIGFITSATHTLVKAGGGTVTATLLSISNSTATPGSTWSATESIDVGNNSGWFFTQPTPRYWVGGTGNWSDVNHWSTGSGGTGGASLPVGDAFFDASSGGGTATIDVSAGPKSLSFAGYTGTLAGTAALTISGSLTMGAGMTRTFTGNINFTASSAQTITSNGIAFDSPINFNGTGSWALQDAFTTGTTRTVTLTQGTFNANNQNFTAGLFSSDNTNTRTLTIGSGVWSITGTGTVWTTSTATNLTLNRGSAVRLTNSSAGARTIISGNTGGTEANAPDISVTAGTGTLVIGLTSSTSKFRHMDYTGFAGSLVASAAPTTWYFVEIYGNLTLSTGMTIPSTMANYYFSGTSGTQVLTGNGKVWEGDVYLQGTGGSYQLADNFTFGATRTVNFTRGTLDLNGKTLSTGLFSSSNANVRAIQFNGGTIDLTATTASTVWDMTTSTNASISLTGGGTIKISGSTTNVRTFAGGGKTYGTLWLSNVTANGQLNITGSNTFYELRSDTPPQTIRFTAGTTTTVGTWNVNGTSGQLTTIASITGGSAWNLATATAPQSCDYLSITDSHATPASCTWFAGSHSSNVSGNTGWIFTAPYPSVPTNPILGTTPICAGASSTIQATYAGGTINYYDAATGGNFIGNGPSATNFTVTPAATTTYYAEAVFGGCVSGTRLLVGTITVAAPAVPTNAVLGTTPICAGSSSTIQATSAGNTINYYDAATGGNFIGNGASATNITVTPVATTTYYAEALASGGCVSTTRLLVGTITVSAPAVPTNAVPGTTPICVGASSTVQATSAGNTINYYDASTGGNFIGNGASATNFTVTPATTTTYYAEAQASGGCVSAMRLLVGTITVNAPPAAPTNAVLGTTPICAGASSTVQATSAGNTINYYDAPTGGNFIGNGASATNFTVTPAASTTYYAETNASGAGCVSTTRLLVGTITVTAPAVPTNAVLGTTPICAGASSTVQATSAGNTINYYDAATGGNFIGNGASATNFTVTPAATTTYYAEAKASGGCVSTTRLLVGSITVNAIPAVPTNAVIGTTPICAGASSTIQATSAGNTINYYDASTGGNFIGNGASATNFTVTPAATTTYYAEANNAGCISATRLLVGTITVNALPAAPTNAILGTTPICAGASSTVQATSAGNTINYYDAPSGGNFIGNGASATNFTVTPAATTTYYAEAITSGGCVSTVRLLVGTITVNVLPTPSISGPTSACASSTGNIYSTTNVTGHTYSWAISGGTIIGSSTGNSISVTWGTGSSGWVQTTETITATTCTVTTPQYNVTINPLPTPTASSTSPVNSGNILNLYSTGGVSYSWIGPNGFTSAVQNPSITNVTMAAAGTYTVTVTGANGCSNTAQTTVTVIAYPAGFYWVNGTGNWNEYAAHWSASPGNSGGVMQTAAPSPTDDVYFDYNSFSGTGQIVTINIANATCKSMTWTGAQYTPTLAGVSGNTLKIYGSLTLIPGMNLTFAGPVSFEATTTGQTVTNAGKSWSNNITFNGIGGGWTLQDALTTSTGSGVITLNNGSLNTNNNSVTAFRFSSTSGTTRSLTLGSSILSFYAYTPAMWDVSSTNMTLSSGTSHIKSYGSFGGFSATFNGGNLVYNNLSFLNTADQPGTVNGNNTFNDIVFTSTSLSYTGTINGNNTIHDIIFYSQGSITGNNTVNNVTFYLTGNIGTGTSTFNNLTFLQSGNISSSNTYNNLTFTPGYTYTLTSTKTQTINGTLTASGSCGAYITIKSNTTASTTLTSPNGFSVNYVYLSYTTATGGTSRVANNSIDLGNNSGWTILSPSSQNLYWVGNSGNWSNGSHWSTTSGGSPSGCSPTSLDNVFFDANSFLIAGQTVTIDVPTASCRNMSWAGMNQNTTFTSTNTLNIYGSLTLVAGMTMNFTGAVSFEATTTGQTVTSAGKSFGGNITFNGIGGGWTLQDALSTSTGSGVITLNNGTLNTNNMAVTGLRFSSTSGTTRSLTLGSSVLSFYAYTPAFWDLSSTNMTFSAGTSHIKSYGSFGGFAATFNGGNLVYNNLSFLNTADQPGTVNGNNTFNDIVFTSTSLSYTGTISGNNTIHDVYFYSQGSITGNNTINNVTFSLTGNIGSGTSTFNNVTFLQTGNITSSNTYNNLTFTPGYTYTLTSAKTQTINGTLSASGTCGAFITIKSNTTAATTLTSPNGFSVNYVYLSYTTATGGTSRVANNSVDLGNNTGWTINSPTGQNLYWVGNSGNWSNGSHWSTTSGGSPSGCSPTSLDNVFFDANSFSLAGQTVTIDVPTASCRNMDWTGMNQNTTFTSANTLNIYGSITLVAGMTMNFTGAVSFEATTTGQTVTSAGKSFGGNITFNGIGGGWTLQDALSTSTGSGVITLNNGTLNTNNMTVTGLRFSSTSGTTRSLTLGSSVLSFYAYTPAFWDVSSTNMTFSAGTSHIKSYGSFGGFAATFNGGNLAYNNLSFLNTADQPGTVNGNNTFNDIVFTSTSLSYTGTINGNNTIHDVFFYSQGSITGNNTIHNVTFSLTGSIGTGISTFNNVTFLQNGNITSSNTFNNLILTPGYTYTLTTGKIQTISAAGFYNITGTASYPIRLQSSSTGTVSTISKASGQVCGAYLQMSDIAGTGGAAFHAGLTSTNMGNNPGWTWNDCVYCTAPTATLSGGSTPICSGTAPAQFSCSASGGDGTYTYLWFLNGISTGITTSTYTAPTLTANATVYCQVTSCSPGQSTNTSTYSITVNSLPTANAGSDSPKCVGTTLDLNSSGGTSYSWTGPNSFSSALQNPSITNVTTAAAGTYTVTVTNTAGCTATASTAVTVNPLPTATITAGGPTNFCNGGSVTLTAGGQGSALVFDGINDYAAINNTTGSNFTAEAWVRTSATSLTGTYAYQGNGIIWADVYSYANDFTIAILNNKLAFYDGSTNSEVNGSISLNDGVWHHIAVVRNGSTSTNSIYVDGIADGTGVASSTPLTANPLIKFGGNTLDGLYFNGKMDEIRIWNVARSQAQIQSTMNTTVAPGISGLMNYYKCDEGSGTLIHDLTVNGNNGILYNGTAWEVPSTSPVGAYFYQWSNSATTESINVTSSGNYTVTTTDLNGCSAVASPLAVTVNNNPVATAGSDSPKCAGTTLNLNSSGGTSYSWTGPNSFSSSTQNPTITNVTTAAAGTYTVTVTNAAGCTATASTAVTINTLPTITCPSNISTYTDAGLCTTTVTYSPATATGIPAPTITYSSVSGSSFTVGTTTVTATATNSCGADYCTFNITVYDTIHPTITCPANITTYADVNCVATGVSLGTPTTQDNCSVASVTNNHASTTYPLGTTSVTWYVTDGSGNSFNCVQRVYVYDTIHPTITCPANITTYADVNCVATGVSLGTPTTQDNCSVASVTNNHASTTYPLGTTSVTWYVTDGSGNSFNCVQRVYVYDTIHPTITCPANITTYADINCVATGVSLGTPTTQDNCSVASVTNNHASTTYPLGTTSVTWYVTDGSGNSFNCVQRVYVYDTIHPTITCPANITTYADVNCVATGVSLGTPTTQDNCSVASVTNNHASTTYPLGTTSVTWYVTDGSGNSFNCVQRVYVYDTIHPTITCPANITTYADVNCVATGVSLGTPTTQDNCSVASVTNNHASTTYPLGTTSVTWYVTDGSGNSFNCVQRVYVYDTIHPTITCPANITTYADVNCVATGVSLGTPTTQDNCSVASVTNNHASTTYPLGTTSVTWYVTDGSGNSFNCVQRVYVYDTIHPTITCPANITTYADINCVATGVSLGTPTTHDNCSVASVTNNHASTTYPLGLTSVTWTITDGSGNSNTCIQAVRVYDTIKPTFTRPVNATLYKNALCAVDDTPAGPAGDVTDEHDNCSTGLQATHTDVVVNNCEGTYTITRTWHLVDDSGNHAADQVQTITVLDTIKPTFTRPANATLYKDALCAVDDTPSGLAGDVTDEHDNCSTGLQATYTDVVVQNCEGTYTITRTWHLVDNCGNHAADQVQTVTILDTIKPVVVCKPDALRHTNNGVCTYSVVGNEFDVVSATDNCSTVTLTYVLSGVTTGNGMGTLSGAVFQWGWTTITWTATDVCGNSAKCSFMTDVKDLEVPTISCATDQTQTADAGICEAYVIVTGPATGDNCGVDNVMNDHNSTANASGMYPVGTTPVIWTVVDVHNNSTSCTQYITVTDNESPEIHDMPADIVQANDNGMCGAIVSWIPPTATDNCGILSFVSNHHPGDYYPVGTTTVTYTATDIHNNVMTGSFDITVNDTELPIITCHGNTVRNTDLHLCTYTVVGNEFDPVTFGDNCPGPVISNDYNGMATLDNAVFDKGTHTIVWTVTDAHGNVITCSFVVDIEDHELPRITCPGNMTENTDPGVCGDTIVYQIINGDNCPDYHILQTTGLPSGSVFPVGTTINSFLVTDASGNTVSCSFTVLIIDNENPTIVCPANQVMVTDPNACTYTFVGNAFDATATDNCGAVIVNNYNHTNTLQGAVFPKGTTTVIWTATDASGNHVSCSYVVTVVDEELPTISCVNDQDRNTTPGACYYYTPVGAEFDPIFVNDNCPGAVITNDYNGSNTLTGAVFPKGITHVTWTVTDASGNVANCGFDITVKDAENPLITCHDLQIRNTDPNLCTYTTVGNEFDPATYSDNCPGATIVNDHNGQGSLNGSVFPLGSTPVVWTVTDASGNVSSCIFIVKVEDHQAPVIHCPADITLCYADRFFQVITMPPAFTWDNCAVQGWTAPQPAEFPIGITYVTWTISDQSGNTSTCIQKVTQSGPVGVSISQSELPVYCQGELVELTANVVSTPPYTPAVAYHWSTGETTQTIQVSVSGIYSVTVTNAWGCVATNSYNVTINTSNLLSSYVILTRHEVHLEGTTVMSGGVGVKGDDHGKMNGKIDAKKSTKITASGTFAKATDIHVDNTSVITTKVLAPANIPWPPFEAMTGHGTITVNVPDNSPSPVTLTGSLYKEIKVGKNSTVIFTQPVVDIEKNFKLEDGATVKFATCTKIHMKENLEAKKNITINPDELGVVWYIDHDVNFDEGAHVTGIFYLGDANSHDTVKHHMNIHESRISRPGIFRGMFLAENLEAKANTYFYLNPLCNNCSPVSPKDLTQDITTPVVMSEPVVKNYPNPFNERTTVLFILPDDNRVKLEVYDLSGKLIQTLYNGEVKSNQEYTVEFDGTALPTGIYIYKMTTNENVITGKMMLNKE